MKRIIQLMAAVKAVASLVFTAGIMIVTVGATVMGREALPLGIIWQAIFLALIFGVLQFLAFSDSVFPRMRTPGRMALLCAGAFATLAVFALAFRWFPASVVNWLVFAGLYAAIFAIAVVVLRIVFRLGGLKYSNMLAAYKARHVSGSL